MRNQQGRRELLHGRPASELKIFISSRMDGSLDAERKAAIKALRSLQIPAPWSWEDSAVASPRSSANVFLEAAGTSDGLVLIVAEAITPATMAEYEAARRNGVPLFVFVKAVRRDAITERFVRAVGNEFTYKKFQTPSELARLVAEAIRQFFVYTWRSSILTFGAGLGETPALVATRTASGQPPTKSSLEGSTALARKASDEIAADMLGELVNELSPMEPSERARSVSYLIDEFMGAGLESLIRAALNTLVPIVQIDDVDDVNDRGWFMNSHGLALSIVGEPTEARRSFEEAESIGRKNGIARLEATALQNLALIALNDNDVDEAERLSHQALALLDRLDDEHQIAQIKLNIAAVAESRGDIEGALRLLDQVESIARAHQFWHLLAATNGARGVTLARRGRLHEAERYIRRCLRSARRRSDHRDELQAMHNLGSLFANHAMPRRAIGWFRRATRLARVLGAHGRAAILEQGTASALMDAGRIAEAIEHLQIARQDADRAGDDQQWAMASTDYGALLLQNEDFAAAERVLGEALGTFARLGDAVGQGVALNNLGAAKEAVGDTRAALDFVDRALAVMPKGGGGHRVEVLQHATRLSLQLQSTAHKPVRYVDERLGLRQAALDATEFAWDVATSATLLAKAGQVDDAMRLFDEALAVGDACDDPELMFHLANDRAVALVEARRLHAGLSIFQNCLSLATTIENERLRLQAISNVAETLRRLDKLEDALVYAHRAVELARELNSADVLGGALSDLGTVLVELDRLADASASFRESIDIAITIDDMPTQARALAGLGNAAFLAGDYDTALDCYGRSARAYRDLERGEDYISSLGASVRLWPRLPRRTCRTTSSILWTKRSDCA